METLCFKVSQPLHNVCLCMCSVCLLQEEVSLMMDEQGTDYEYSRCQYESFYPPTPSTTVLSGVPLGPWAI